MPKPGSVYWTAAQVLLTLLVLFSVAKCDEPVCSGETICPKVESQGGSIGGWETSCSYFQEPALCGDTENRNIPAAPSNVIVTDVIHEVEVDGTRVLGLKIRWMLPPGNVTGLEGFYIILMKTSYPVGRNDCNKIGFANRLQVPSFTSEVQFTYSCWRKVEVDSIYKVTVISIGSGQSSHIIHHTSNCGNVLGVASCPSVLVEPDDWQPSQHPNALARNDIVIVFFEIYPFDFYMTYRINIQPCDNSNTPASLSHMINTNGTSSSEYNYNVLDVPPGCYRAKVLLFMTSDGAPVDGFEVPSNSFNVTGHIPVPVHPTSSVESTPGVLATSVEGIPAIRKPPKSESKTVLWGSIGGAVGAVIAVVLLLVIFVNRGRMLRNSGHTDTVHSSIDDGEIQSNDYSNLAQNMSSSEVDEDVVKSWQQNNETWMHNDVYADALKQDSVSEYHHCGNNERAEDNPGHCCAGHHPSIWEDCGSVTGMSGVTV